MKIRTIIAVSLLAVAALAFSACGSNDPDLVPVSFNLTDAPVDSAAISKVYVSFGGLEVNSSSAAAEDDSSWVEVPIDASAEYDLLSLSEGVTALLGNVELEAGSQVNQIRFLDPTIEIVETADPATRLPCSLSSSTGLKIVNAFDVPLTGSLSLTVDFDVRKSLVSTASGYKMKPTLRAIVDGEAGRIGGTIPEGYAVFAYRDGDYDAELGDPAADANSPAFANAYTSAAAKAADGGGFAYTLAFLEAGTYDLVVVPSGSDAAAAIVQDVAVASGQKTVSDITLP